MYELEVKLCSGLCERQTFKYSVEELSLYLPIGYSGHIQIGNCPKLGVEK
jgi:hypothetical protein